MMARAGLVGGLGPESTVDYYKRIIDLWQRHQPGAGRRGCRLRRTAVCARYGITVIPPDEEDRAGIHQRYLGELLKGEFTSSTRAQFRALVANLRDQKGIDGVIIGGTELPLLLPDETIAGVPALDTTALHVEAIVSRLREVERTT